jgi:hypothetical protein
MAVAEDLFQVGDAAANALSQVRDSRLQGAVAAVRKACDEAKRSWSGSNLGYHATVYYDGLNAKPADVQFSPEWGLMDVWPTHQPDRGWRMMDHHAVVEQILARASHPDIEEIARTLASIRESFLSLKERAISLLTAVPADQGDSFLARKLDQIKGLTVAHPDAIEPTLVERGRVYSRDSTAVSQGFRVAPHQSVMAICLSAAATETGLDSLDKATRESAQHLREKEIGRLDPWSVIRGFVLTLSSHDVPAVIDRAGLAVDWQLTLRQAYSNGTRLSAYRPRIDAAYRSLSNLADRMRVAFVVARELAGRGLSEPLQEALREIGWELQNDRLKPSTATVRELFLPNQSQHDAYVEIRGILKGAHRSITIVDPYIDQSILSLLSACSVPRMSIQILTSKHPPDLSLEAKKWLSQNAGRALEIRTSREFHDRFIILDDSVCWHVGASIKDAGTKACMLSQVEDDENRNSLLAQIRKSWANGANVL